jgi:NTE family protein
MRIGLVLGAGGTVGMAFHAGVLRALADAGWDATSADLIVGTSAGSVIGSQLRAGRSVDEIWARAEGTAERRPRTFERAWRSRADFAGRALGAAIVTGRAALRVPGLGVGPALVRSMRAGLYSSEPAIRAFRDDLGMSWPEGLWVVAVDSGRGQRVVFGRDEKVHADPGIAIASSCAVPGVFEPVRHDGMVLVDGGVWSTTNLDLVAGLGFDLVICAAPMAFDPSAPPAGAMRMTRTWATRALRAEARRVRAGGTEVLLIRPNATQLAIHGRGNALRVEGLDDVARAARDATTAFLAGQGFVRMPATTL